MTLEKPTFIQKQTSRDWPTRGLSYTLLLSSLEDLGPHWWPILHNGKAFCSFSTLSHMGFFIIINKRWRRAQTTQGPRTLAKETNREQQTEKFLAQLEHYHTAESCYFNSLQNYTSRLARGRDVRIT